MASKGEEAEAAADSLLKAVVRMIEVSCALGGDAPVRATFLARAMNALWSLAPELDARRVRDAVGARSDYGVLLAVLEDPRALEALRRDDPLAAARLRGLGAREVMLEAEGGVLSVEQVARHLRLTRQAVDKRRRAGRLLALEIGRRGYAYPAWQFDERGVLLGFESVLRELGVRDPWMQAAFFLSGDPRLDGASPLEVLRRGEFEAVLRAARGYGQHGAA